MFCTFISAVLLLKYCFPTGDQWRRKQFESGGAQFPALRAGKNFFTVPLHFFMVPPT